MIKEQPKNGNDLVCSFCGKRGFETKAMISSQTGSGNICDECLNVIADLQWEEVVETAAEAQSQDASLAPSRLMKPQIVTRFVSEEVHPATWSSLGIDWICDGCGWRLRLDSNEQPPREHSYEIVMSRWHEIRVEIPKRKFVNMCNARWRRAL
jgi:hypothetical protein